MELDFDNEEFNLAFELVKNSTHNIFLTGKAGTGKTTFLKYVREYVGKTMAIVAPTGIAAINAGGTTINSLFQIRPSVYHPNDKRLRTKALKGEEDTTTIYDHFQYRDEKRKLLEALELLVIDEVSMVRCDLLDVVDKLLRVFGGGNSALPFGGKQLLLIGDPFQLPPVTRNDDWDILGRIYKSAFFFGAKSFQEANPACIELKKIYRQSDRTFIDLLNKVRVANIDASDQQLLNSRISQNGFDFKKEGYIYLGTHNARVDAINEQELAKIQKPLFNYEGIIKGKFPENDLPAEKNLCLKEGARVMFVKNDASTEKRYYNGKLGTVKSLQDDKIEITLDKGLSILVEKATWEKIKYQWNEKKQEIEEIVEGSFEQYPLRLAWAITVHKSQGLTLEKVFGDLENSFAPGQVYVALSRCTSFEGLRLKTPIPTYRITTSPKVMSFSKQFLEAEGQDSRIAGLKNELKFNQTLDLLKNGSPEMAFDSFISFLRSGIDLDIKPLKAAFVGRLKRVPDLERKLAEKEKQIVNLNGQLSNEKKKIDSKDQRIKELLIDQMFGQNDSYSALNQQIQKLRAELIDKNQKIKSQDNQITKLIAKQNSKKAIVEKTTKDVQPKTKELKTQAIAKKKNWFVRIFGS